MTRRLILIAALGNLAFIMPAAGQQNSFSSEAELKKPLIAARTVNLKPLLPIKPAGEIMQMAEAVFPEAYTQFMAVGLERQDIGEIWPASMSFWVPARFFEQALTQEVLDKRLSLLMSKILRPGDAACESIHYGPVEELAWQAWPDKTVRKVTMLFNIGC